MCGRRLVSSGLLIGGETRVSSDPAGDMIAAMSDGVAVPVPFGLHRLTEVCHVVIGRVRAVVPYSWQSM
jgi:hypothetical protein